MNDIAKLTLKAHKEESLKRFHPWIFSGAIAGIDREIDEGDLVAVYSANGDPLGIGHFAPSTIAVRMLSFDTGETINRDFWLKRLSAAYKLRESLGLISNENNSYRLVHGEGDNLPGLIIDVYGDTAVMQAHTLGMHNVAGLIAELLPEITGGAVQAVYYKSANTLPHMADVEVEDGFIFGNNSNVNVARENGLQFYPDWKRGQKTGFFLDQRDNRALLKAYADGRRVLNMFCYTGGFSLFALAGNAEKVVSVDSSSKAIDLAVRNVALNFANSTRHQAVAEDAFRYLEQIEKGAYDLIVLDPPAFAKHRKVLHNALKGYRRLNTIAFEKIASGGVVFTFSCSQAVSREEFRQAVFSAAAAAKREVRILHQMTQPSDHPINIYHPEGEYLKGLVLYVD
ncbi:SAM-dependent methyltransferase [Porphyromonas crevioricanis]|uniref:SAM-dependent methyltransferase n=2 Tax=Porphyromonas crevioricanis TaxID=393921 RepID=A0AB34PF89_9PORP|nr:SAM-dependent methyltransferase [Porphyromonas crevioricanis]KGN94322.1 SAM-dependent methyltransferase [Porphyromonas crevioricanis]GAD04789.1 LSU m5C1962 methyltransferase RlmI [Porphyromonas crevioricanis JCM 15906]SJZ98236.1 SAM-dependent methyltransferase [Porphyromonas crevioricanis]